MPQGVIQVVRLIDNAFFRVALAPALNVTFVRRTNRPFEELEECERIHSDVARTLDTLNRRVTKIFYDLRSAPARNDPAFEAVLVVYRKRFFEKMFRSAVLVRTASGKMQVSRHMREDGNDVGVFVDQREAYKHLDVTAEVINALAT